MPSEAVACRCSSKQVFLKISQVFLQISQETQVSESLSHKVADLKVADLY